MGEPEVKTESVPETETKEENLSANDGTPDVKPETEVKEENLSAKDETSDVNISELEKKIITQIEYYFGNHNLVNDKFMQGKIKEDDGWIAFSVLLTFNRLKTLTTEAPVVVKALKKSTKDLIQVSDDETKIRRNPELPLPSRGNWKDEEWQRTVYVKGFPVDSSMDNILEFFKNEGNTINIFMKKNFHSRAFKGSVFVTFETKDEAETFAKKEGQKYKSTVLIKEMRQDYQDRKHNEFIKRKEDREKRKLEKQEKGEGEEDTTNFNPDEDMQKDCLMKLTGFVEGTTREDIKEKLSPHGNIAYVDFKIGDTEAVIRFEESGIAKDVLEKSKTGPEGEKKLIIKDAEISASFPEGDEEVEYWKKIMAARSNFVKTKKNHKRRGGFRGGRGDFRGRGRGGRGRGGHNRFERRRSFSNDSDKNGNTAGSDRKRTASASNDDAPQVKTGKPESPPRDRKRQAAQAAEGEKPAKVEKADS